MTSTDLKSQLSDDLFLSGDDVHEAYAKDWSESIPHLPEVVLRPRTTDDLVMMMRLANETGQPLVTQGGRTGLAGGATPRQGEYAL